MKKFKVITTDTLEKIAKCFSGDNEVVSFITDLEEVIDDIHMCMIRGKRSNDAQGSRLILEEICYISLFCREYIELIRDLVRNIDLHEIDEEQLNTHRLKTIKDDEDQLHAS